MNDLMQLLSQVPLFASLKKSELEHLTTDPHIIEVPPKEVLFFEGEIGERFYVILEGRIEVVKQLGSDDEQILGVRGPGEFVGEMSLLHRDGKRTASVVTQESSKLLELTRTDFDELLTHEPMMAYEMVRVLSSRLTTAHETHISDLQEKNRELREAFEALKAAQAQIIEKEKLERDLKLASDIQMSILPQTLPRVEGFDFGAQLVPARTVAGDMYDFIPLGHNKVGIVVGDVTDKGVSAAIVMSQTHALLRAEAYRASSPLEALMSVNQHLLEINSSGLPVTAIFGVLDGTTNEFIYARAGHELPLICTGEGEVTQAEKGLGQPLGYFEEPKIDENTISLPADGTFLLYTDGVTEGLDDLDLASMNESLMSEISLCKGKSAQAICDHVLEVTTSRQGDRLLLDDVTLVAVHRLG
ncbi:MAG: SpoIIE family protein phosphatase [Anaerolineaceae bacterium]|nr:MAG: SpoIIE family protein phosphatase [Anaerolineaceae bacterium]